MWICYHLTAYPYYLPFIIFFKKSPQMFGKCIEAVYICYVIEREPTKTRNMSHKICQPPLEIRLFLYFIGAAIVSVLIQLLIK
jgi:hypothetical protein